MCVGGAASWPDGHQEGCDSCVCVSVCVCVQHLSSLDTAKKKQRPHKVDEDNSNPAREREEPAGIEE